MHLYSCQSYYNIRVFISSYLLNIIVHNRLTFTTPLKNDPKISRAHYPKDCFTLDKEISRIERKPLQDLNSFRILLLGRKSELSRQPKLHYYQCIILLFDLGCSKMFLIKFLSLFQKFQNPMHFE